MKAEITHEQTITIPAETTAQAVSIAADVAALTAVQAQAKAARETVRAAMMEDPDWQAARELKKQIKMNTAGTREEIKALETAARERQSDTDAGRCLDSARMQAGRIRHAIDRKIGDVGQLLLPLYREDGHE